MEQLTTTCDSDGTDGVSWEELESCMKEYQEKMDEREIPRPSREKFNSLDTNSDGILTDAEWQKFRKSQTCTVQLPSQYCDYSSGGCEWVCDLGVCGCTGQTP